MSAPFTPSLQVAIDELCDAQRPLSGDRAYYTAPLTDDYVVYEPSDGQPVQVRASRVYRSLWLQLCTIFLRMRYIFILCLDVRIRSTTKIRRLASRLRHRRCLPR